MTQRNLLSIYSCQLIALLFLSVLVSSAVAEEKVKQRQTGTSKKDLHTYQLVARVAYQIGKDKLSLQKNNKPDSLKTENGRIEASIDKLTPVAGDITKASKIQEVSFHALFDWPEFPISKADMSIPVVMALSCEDSVTGHVWTDFGKPVLRIHKGQPAVAEVSLGRSGSMVPGKYLLTAMLFVKLSPESSLSLMDIKQIKFTIEPEAVKTSPQQKSNDLKDKK
ncbi:hypothetical protein [uncultured Gimesia sp.]|uniref:hypothetical protein n=1 Tax=uncultured Gimesia sp. TaxID=1678688 RepID=UPI0030DC0A62|tara:strand:- start:107874 stop:108542 length:669 start_codon:yes stop_codon:yes gene_type:complete